MLIYFKMSSVSHDPSEIILIYWFAAQETFLIIITVENMLHIFVETDIFQDSSKTKFRMLKIIYLKEIFCSIIHLSAATFDQFNASLLKKFPNIKMVEY